jgi:hypothetical protein
MIRLAPTLSYINSLLEQSYHHHHHHHLLYAGYLYLYS